MVRSLLASLLFVSGHTLVLANTLPDRGIYKGSQWEASLARAIRERKPLMVIHKGQNMRCGLNRDGAYSTATEFKHLTVVVLLNESDKAEAFPPELKPLLGNNFYGMKALLLHPVQLNRHFRFSLKDIEASGGERRYFKKVHQKINTIRAEYLKDPDFPAPGLSPSDPNLHAETKTPGF